MKILLLQSKPFLPVLDGGNEASRALTAELISLGHDIDCLTFSSEKHPFISEEFKVSPWKQINIDHVRVNLKIKPIPAFRALASGKSYNLARFSHSDWTEKIKEKSKSQFDIVLIDSLFASEEIEYIKESFPKSIFILRAHNVEHQIWTEHAENEHSFLKKTYLKSIARQLKKREIVILQQFDVILAISDLDKNNFSKITDSKIEPLPYFPEIDSTLNSSLSSNFFFLGSMNWIPNEEAHEELTKYIIPKIQEQSIDAQLVFGGSAQNEIEKSSNKGISYAGFVENKFEFMKNNGSLLAPIKSGSGLRIKIIEALSVGVPVVTTQKGAEGIPFENGDGILIAQNDHEFVQFALKLNQDKEFRTEISTQAKKNLQEWKSKFALKTIFDKYVQ